MTEQHSPRLMYPRYQTVEIDWIGDIPVEWTTRRIKQIGHLGAGAGFPHSAQGAEGEELPFIKVSDMNLPGNGVWMTEARNTVSREAARQLGAEVFSEGSLIFPKVGAALLTNKRRILARPSCVDNNVMVFSPREGDPRYLLKVLELVDLGQLANPGAVPSVNESQVKEIVVPFPDAQTQQRIADFLDRETAKIDRLIEQKERLIELLQEKRAALITRAVTRGLDPDVEMKDSGVEWLGAIPAHWDVRRLVHCCRADVPIVYGILKPGLNVDDGVPYIGAGDVKPERLDLATLPRTTKEISQEFKRSIVKGGELVYAIRGSFGNVEVVPSELEGANLSRDAARIAPRSGVNSSWLAWALRSMASQSQFRYFSIGTAVTGVNIRDLKRVQFPFPPEREQRQIADYLAEVTGAMAGTANQVIQAISLLREYRTALISATVTGKIDVRNHEEVA